MSGRGLLDADMHTVGRWIATGARLWLDELRQLVPPWLIRSTRRGGARLRFDPADGVLYPVDRPVRRGGRAIVQVPREMALVRVLEQPLLSQRDLGRLLMLDRDRIMPFPGEDAVVAGRIVEPRPEIRRASVEVAGLPPARARAVAGAIGASSIVPTQVVIENPPSDDRPPIDLLDAFRDAGLLALRRSNASAWWAMVAFLFAMNLGAIIWRDAASVDRLQQIVDEQQAAVGVSRAIASRIASGDRVAAAVSTARHRREPLGLLGAISAAMPPGAWIQRLAWEGETLRFAGYRPPNADVLGALRRVGRLRDVRSGSAEELAPIPVGQPFDVTARLRSR